MRSIEINELIPVYSCISEAFVLVKSQGFVNSIQCSFRSVQCTLLSFFYFLKWLGIITRIALDEFKNAIPYLISFEADYFDGADVAQKLERTNHELQLCSIHSSLFQSDP